MCSQRVRMREDPYALVCLNDQNRRYKYLFCLIFRPRFNLLGLKNSESNTKKLPQEMTKS